MEACLDKGRGACHLRRPEIAHLVEETIRSFHGDRLDLGVWVVMPNHVHPQCQVGPTPVAGLLESWKKHTAFEVNQLLQRRGRFWQVDDWDTFMRDTGEELKTRNRIESNPAKACLVLGPKTRPGSSTRFRNMHGGLRL